MGSPPSCMREHYKTDSQNVNSSRKRRKISEALSEVVRPRKSPRLQKRAGVEQPLTTLLRKGNSQDDNHGPGDQLPSPVSSINRKRKVDTIIETFSSSSQEAEKPTSKRKYTESTRRKESVSNHEAHPRVHPNSATKALQLDDLSPIAHWVATRKWPKDFGQKINNMSLTPQNKRKSDSTHRSDRLERLAENGVFMKTSASVLQSSKKLCQILLDGKLRPTEFVAFPIDKFPDVLERVQSLNESRIQKDLTPWIVPSAENLFFCGESQLDYIGDEFNAEWTRCATLGSTRPKPDYAAGLLSRIFGKEEMQKLRNYATPTRPVFFTPELCFPFLTCEVKTGEQGMNTADRQNIHSASIAIKAIVELYKVAYGETEPERVQELHGQILAFSVSHDNDVVRLYGHFPVLVDIEHGKLEFYRYLIDLFSLSRNDGEDRYKGYNFVRNVYEKFAPQHLKRIQNAIALLPLPLEATGLSFNASDLALDEIESKNSAQEAASSEDTPFQKPGLPASLLQRDGAVAAELKRQNEQQRQQIEKLMQQNEQERHKLMQQIENLTEMLKQQVSHQTECRNHGTV